MMFLMEKSNGFDSCALRGIAAEAMQSSPVAMGLII